jgi:hypothetical protein
VPIIISGLEKRQNIGEAAVLDLLQAKTVQAEASAIEILNHAIVSGKLPTGATGNLNQFAKTTRSVRRPSWHGLTMEKRFVLSPHRPLLSGPPGGSQLDSANGS